MQLNHLDLSVPDLDAAAAFFEQGFGFKPVNRFDDMRILVGDGPFVLALTRSAEPRYPASFHIGFLQASRQGVTEAHQRLLAAGIEVAGPPAEQHGAFLFYCRVPGGTLVEIAYRPA
jgi:catechol 2,3-dioxygenase-like lactoylglutathione lyase family enzyme